MDAGRRLLLAVAACAWAATTRAQGGKPLVIVVPYPAGGSSDAVARTIAQPLSARLKRPVMIDNRPGANGQIGLEQVARSAPDGDTLFFAVASIMAMNPSIYGLRRDDAASLVPVVQTTTGPFVLVASSDAAYATFAQFVSFAKANPGKLAYGSPGNGSHAHVGMELLKQAAGIDVRHVPYKGGAPALQDLLGRQIDLVLDTPVSVVPHVRSGRLRALVTTGSSRPKSLPDVPLASDALQGLQVEGWHGLFAPRGTPDGVALALNAEIRAVLNEPDVTRRLVESGFDVVANTPQEFAAVVEADRRRYSRTIASAGIRGD